MNGPVFGFSRVKGVIVPSISVFFSSNAVTLPASSVIGGTAPSAWTIESWIRMGDYQNYRTVFGAGTGRDEWLFGVKKRLANAPFRIVFYQSGGTAGDRFVGTVDISSDNYPTVGASAVWTHIALAYGSGTFDAYVNGVADSTGVAPLRTVNATITNTGRDLFGDTTSAEDLQGRATEFRFWNVKRTATEIAGLYDKRAAGMETGLVACFPCSENTGTTTTDLVAGVVGTFSSTNVTWDAAGPTLY